MERKEALRLMALASGAALVTGCGDSVVAVGDLADDELRALALRARRLRVRLNDRVMTAELLQDSRALIDDVQAFGRRYDREVPVQDGLTIDDIPPDVQSAAAMVSSRARRPRDPKCECKSYWTGCLLYMPFQKWCGTSGPFRIEECLYRCFNYCWIVAP